MEDTFLRQDMMCRRFRGQVPAERIESNCVLIQHKSLYLATKHILYLYLLHFYEPMFLEHK